MTNDKELDKIERTIPDLEREGRKHPEISMRLRKKDLEKELKPRYWTWQSEDRQLEVLVHSKTPHDSVEKFIIDHRGKPSLITLASGERIRVLLVDCYPHGHGLLRSVRQKTGEVLIFRITHIQTMAVD